MTLFDVLSFIGGLSLFLFGMSVMGRALERRAGPNLKSMLGRITGSKSGGKKYDTPDTGGFADAEDFYEFYRDDFYDLEDAEDYYYANGGE